MPCEFCREDWLCPPHYLKKQENEAKENRLREFSKKQASQMSVRDAFAIRIFCTMITQGSSASDYTTGEAYRLADKLIEAGM